MYNRRNVRTASSSIALLLLLYSIVLPILPTLLVVQPAFAINASPPSLTASPNAFVATVATALTLTATNPASNSFAVTSLTVVAPSGWSFSDLPTAFDCGAPSTLLGSDGASSSSARQCFAGTGSGLPPGFSTTLTLGSVTGPASAATSPPVTGTFTTIVVDASSAASYAGASFNLFSIASTTVSVTPGTTAFTAGSAPITVTATLSSAQPGVPIVFSAPDVSYADATFSLSPSSANTGATGTVSTTFTPSNNAADLTVVRAKIGTSAIQGDSGPIDTGPGPVNRVTFVFVPAVATNYLDTSGTDAASVLGASMPATEASYSITDAFLNALNFDTISSIGITVTALAGGGRFSPAGTATFAAVFCGTAAVGQPAAATFTCPATVSSTNLPFAYFQATPFNSIGRISATITGTSAGASVSVTGTTANIVTSTFATASPTPTITGVITTGTFDGVNCAANATSAGCRTAGTSVTVRADITDQTGVPVILQLHNAGSSTSYAGTFAGANSVTVNTNSTGGVSASFAVDTTFGRFARFNARVVKPTDASPANILANSTTPSLTVITIAGDAASFTVDLCFLSYPGTPPACPSTDVVSTGAVAGTSIFLRIRISDAFANKAVNPGPGTIQITLTPSAGSILSATTIFIAAGSSDTVTAPSFGPVAWTLPTTLAVTASVSAIGVLSGVSRTASASVTTVSGTPTIAVTSPAPLAGVIYSSSTTVIFSGQANASRGFPTTVTINSVAFRIGTGPWQSAVITAGNKVVWSVAATFASGLGTIQFNATDSRSPANTVLSPVFTVLVDPSAPTISFVTADGATLSAGQPVQAAIVDTLGALNATSVTATRNGTAIAAASISVTGTNNPGSNVTYSVSISGLPSGRWVIQLNARDLAGNVATPRSITVVIVVPTNQSFTIVGTPSRTTIAGSPAIATTFANNLPASQTGVLVGVARNQLGQAAGIATATITPGAGASAEGFLVFVGLAPGTYTVEITVITPAGVVISATITFTLTV